MPWFSRPDLPWPTMTKRNRRRRKVPAETVEDVQLPSMPAAEHEEVGQELNVISLPKDPRSDTSSTARQQSEEAASTTPTTPSSLQQHSTTFPVSSNPLLKPVSRIAAAVPIIPVIPKPASRTSSGSVLVDQKPTGQDASKDTSNETAAPVEGNTDAAAENEGFDVKSAPLASGPKLWTGLFKGGPVSVSAAAKNGTQAPPDSSTAGGFNKTYNESVADALRVFNATAQDAKLPFLKPRGLVNTGNMCYMNSVSGMFVVESALLIFVRFYKF